jgi:hypothetical protein
VGVAVWRGIRRALFFSFFFFPLFFHFSFFLFLSVAFPIFFNTWFSPVYLLVSAHFMSVVQLLFQ